MVLRMGDEVDDGKKSLDKKKNTTNKMKTKNNKDKTPEKNTMKKKTNCELDISKHN